MSSISLPPAFSLNAVDAVAEPTPEFSAPAAGAPQAPAIDIDADENAIPANLCIFAELAASKPANPTDAIAPRTFQGNGFNTIWRPTMSTDAFSDATLELNVTLETLQFMTDLGNIFNRGSGPNQKAAILKGVPYTQHISDLLNPATGKADLSPPTDIHFEQGLFVSTPITTNPPVSHPTITRMASVPHGSTFSAQGVLPDAPTNGKPTIEQATIAPFQLSTLVPNVPPKGIVFPQTTMGPVNFPRIPQDLSKFQGTIKQESINDPNQVLNDFNNNSQRKSFQDFTRIDMTSVSSDACPGGGTTNIAFLPNNANTFIVVCTYWISHVLWDCTLPAGDHTKDNGKFTSVTPDAALIDKVPAPTFSVQLSTVVKPGTVVKLPSLQIQYSQSVRLDFNKLGWPHVSVANLLPADPVQILQANMPKF